MWRSSYFRRLLILASRRAPTKRKSSIARASATRYDQYRSLRHPLLRAASNEAGSNGNTWASAWTNRTRSHPLAARRANASTAADRSTPTTVPSGATARARSSAVSPPPQPMSKTLSPGCGASAAKARRPSGASCSSNGSRTSAHAPTRTSSWVSAGKGLIWSMRRSLPDSLGMSRSPCKPPLYVLNVGCRAG
jgi:hypothetical protein